MRRSTKRRELDRVCWELFAIGREAEDHESAHQRWFAETWVSVVEHIDRIRPGRKFLSKARAFLKLKLAQHGARESLEAEFWRTLPKDYGTIR